MRSQASFISSDQLQNHQDVVGLPINSSMTQWAVYIVIVGLALIIAAQIIKSLKDCECDIDTSFNTQVEVATASETDRSLLLPKKLSYPEYGTCTEQVFEATKCSRSSSSSSQHLYDGNICVICYDGQRNCFFVPCGHSITCYACAQRIMEGEMKTCPVCRRVVRKVRKLLTL